MANTHAGWRHPAPTRLESLLFVALMSGPPKLRERDMSASLHGTVDIAVLIQVVVWGCAALWVFGYLYPSVMRRGTLPRLHTPQVLALLFVGAMSLSLPRSPGVLLTAFMLGQFLLMLSFPWVFGTRFGPSALLRHLFAGASTVALMLGLAAVFKPHLVFIGENMRLRGDLIAPAGPVAVLVLVFCLADAPRLRGRVFWPAVLFCGALLVISQTRTSFIALALFLALGFLVGRGLRVRKFVPLLLVVVAALALLDAYGPARDYIVRDEETVQNMSDRLPLWTHLYRAVMRGDPVIGLGYYAATRVLAPQHNPALGNAHSVFVEVLVGGGWLALVCYVALLVSLIWHACRLLITTGGKPATMAALGVLILGIAQAITSSETLHAGPLGFSFWSMAVLLPLMYCEAAARTATRPVRVASTSEASGLRVDAGRPFPVR